MHPFEVGAERIARPFRDAYGWLERPLQRARGERAPEGADRAAHRTRRSRTRPRPSELERLEALLDYRALRHLPRRLRAVGATVIADPPSRFEQWIVISAGSQDGVRKDAPVVDGRGPRRQGDQGDARPVAGHAAHGQGERGLGVRRADRGVRRDPPRRRLRATRSSSTACRRRTGCSGTTSSSPRAAGSACCRRSTRATSRSAWSRASARPTSTCTSRSRCEPFVDFSSLDSVLVLVRKTPEPRCREPLLVDALKAAVLLFARRRRAGDDRGLDPDPRRHARPRARASCSSIALLRGSIFGAARRLLGGLPARHRLPRDARRHLAAADAGRLLDRTLRRDDRPRPRARAVPLGRRGHRAVRVRRARAALPARRAGRRRGPQLVDALPADAAPQPAADRCRSTRSSAGCSRPSVPTGRVRGGASSLASPTPHPAAADRALPAARPARRGALPPHARARAADRDPRRDHARASSASSSSASGRCRCSPATQYLRAAQNNQLRTIRVEAPRGAVLDTQRPRRWSTNKAGDGGPGLAGRPPGQARRARGTCCAA